jgi:hypothetical protein
MSEAVLWLIVAVVALILAGVFAVFVPRADKINAATGMPFLIARWGHSLVWLLLAVSFAFRGSQTALGALSDPIAILGGLTYLVFITTYLRLTRA